MEKTFLVEKEEKIVTTYEVKAESEEKAVKLVKAGAIGEEDAVAKESAALKVSVKGDRNSETFEWFLNYFCVDEEADRGAEAATFIEKFENRLGFKLNPKLSHWIPEKTSFSESDLKKIMVAFAKRNLESIVNLQYAYDDSDEFDAKFNGRHVVKADGLKLYQGASGTTEYNVISVASNRVRGGADEAILGTFQTLTGLSLYFTKNHVIVETGDTERHYQYDWDNGVFAEKPFIRFTRNANRNFVIAE